MDSYHIYLVSSLFLERNSIKHKKCFLYSNSTGFLTIIAAPHNSSFSTETGTVTATINESCLQHRPSVYSPYLLIYGNSNAINTYGENMTSPAIHGNRAVSITL